MDKIKLINDICVKNRERIEMKEGKDKEREGRREEDRKRGKKEKK